MTKFIINNQKNQIIVNALVLNRDNVIVFLSKLYKKYPYPNNFTINDLINNLQVNYSDKTIRAMIIIYDKMKFIVKISPIHQKPVEYQFINNLELSDMIIHLSNMGMNNE